MSKHTPGAWELISKNGHSYKFHVLDSDRKMVVMLGHNKSYWAASQGEKDSVRATAKLIAAAPDLLEALEELLAVAVQYDLPLSDPERIKARAAIARARGEE